MSRIQKRIALPGGLVFALSVLLRIFDWLSRLDFARSVAERLGFPATVTAPADWLVFLRDWGWVLGAIWLSGVWIFFGRPQNVTATHVVTSDPVTVREDAVVTKLEATEDPKQGDRTDDQHDKRSEEQAGHG